MDPQEVFQILRDTGALLEGHFELRSKLHSDRYFQCANVLCYPRHAQRLCEALVEKLKSMVSGLKVDGVLAPAMGGIIVGHEVARVLGVKSIFVEKEEGALVLKRFRIGKGERYVVAEDVVTRGGRVEETARIVEEGGGRVAAVVMLVDRSGRRAKFPYPTVSLLEMEPVTYEPDECPLCAKGIPMVHPGS